MAFSEMNVKANVDGCYLRLPGGLSSHNSDTFACIRGNSRDVFLAFARSAYKGYARGDLTKRRTYLEGSRRLPMMQSWFDQRISAGETRTSSAKMPYLPRPLWSVSSVSLKA